MTTEIETAQPQLGTAPAPARQTALRAAICAEAVQQCRDWYGDRLQAIILTGSLARDEATFLEADGRCRLLGDAELLLIFRKGCDLARQGDLDSLRDKIGIRLLRQKISCPVSMSCAHPAYLRRLRPAIFAYELRSCGRVLWGEDRILSLVPAFSPAEIPLEDAWRLLCNRMMEQLEVVDELSDRSASLSLRVQYATVKLYLDMATSLLVFAGAYEPSYRARAERLSTLAESAALDKDSPFPPRHFAEHVAAFTRWKLSPGDAPSGLDWASWEAAVNYARWLWRWELARLCGAQSNLSEPDLWKRAMRLQPLWQRLRGWLYVLRAQGWDRSWRQWPRWVRCAWEASPRYGVYAAGSRLFFHLPCLLRPSREKRQTAIDWQGVGAWLPVTIQFNPEQATGSWRQLAADIVWNYHRFLVGTRS